ncbi:MAG: hypothetical protein HC923_04110, partial [Myxococcales bacterium]|nr:hypothetical protein [Myxococcales bacterium]
MSLLDSLAKGQPLEPNAELAFERMLGHRVGLEGLSRLFQPSFPGVRTYAIEERAAPDQAVELTLVGVARDGRSVWTGSRAFVRGRDGSLEIHRGFDEVDLEYQSRNITTDLMMRELELLDLFGGGPSARLTIDADSIGRYVCALHGFIFADETEEGPSTRSLHAFEPDGDRDRENALHVGAAPILEGQAEVLFRDLRPGKYAASVVRQRGPRRERCRDRRACPASRRPPSPGARGL